MVQGEGRVFRPAGQDGWDRGSLAGSVTAGAEPGSRPRPGQIKR